MKVFHNPVVDLRYWVLISMASVFGTNTGDLAVKIFRKFSDLSDIAIFGLKHSGPLPFLIAIFLLLYAAERFDKLRHEIYFWAVIVIIRTAATNIADALAGDLHIGFYLLTGIFSASLAYLAVTWQQKRPRPIATKFTPETTELYWLTMLIAGVLGTIVGDELSHAIGLSQAALVLSLGMALLVYLGYRSFLALTAAYWFGIAFARIAGTAVGDWLAKSTAKGGSGLDLETATVISGLFFLAIAYFWRSTSNKSPNKEAVA